MEGSTSIPLGLAVMRREETRLWGDEESNSKEFTSEAKVYEDVVSGHDFFTPSRLGRLVEYSDSLELSERVVGLCLMLLPKGGACYLSQGL